MKNIIIVLIALLLLVISWVFIPNEIKKPVRVSDTLTIAGNPIGEGYYSYTLSEKGQSISPN